MSLANSLVHIFSMQLEVDIEQCQIAERLYQYMYDFWISPYPIVDELLIEDADPKPFPLFSMCTQKYLQNSTSFSNTIVLSFLDQTSRDFSSRVRRPGQVSIKQNSLLVYMCAWLTLFCLYISHVLCCLHINLFCWYATDSDSRDPYLGCYFKPTVPMFVYGLASMDVILF